VVPMGIPLEHTSFSQFLILIPSARDHALLNFIITILSFEYFLTHNVRTFNFLHLE
jgi:hypothetical protein